MKGNSIIYYCYCLIILGIVHPFVWGIAISDYSAEVNDRFGGGDSSFIGYGYDFSGVGIASSSHWATMISNNVFISSGHLHPITNETITYWKTNDQSGSSVTRKVFEYKMLGEIALGVLENPLPDDYETYEISSFYDKLKKLDSNGFFYNKDVFLVGKINNSSFAVGHAEIYNYGNYSTPHFHGKDSDNLKYYYTREYYNDPPTTLLQNGDSGTPVFLYDSDSSSMTLLGHSFAIANIVNDQGNVVGQRNYLSDLDYYREDINEFIKLHAIPEPATIIGVSPVVALGIFRFWRNRSRKS